MLVEQVVSEMQDSCHSNYEQEVASEEPNVFFCEQITRHQHQIIDVEGDEAT
jgi:hypothetical protein